MTPPDEMTHAAHRAQLWSEMRRALLKLLREDEEQRELYADLAIRSVSRVGDKAIREVLAVVNENEERETATVKEWRLLRREAPALSSNAAEQTARGPHVHATLRARARPAP